MLRELESCPGTEESDSVDGLSVWSVLHQTEEQTALALTKAVKLHLSLKPFLQNYHGHRQRERWRGRDGLAWDGTHAVWDVG